MNYIVTDRNDNDRETPIIDVLATLSAAERLVSENGYGEIEKWENAEDCIIPALKDYISENAGSMGPETLRRNCVSTFYTWLPKSVILNAIEQF